MKTTNIFLISFFVFLSCDSSERVNELNSTVESQTENSLNQKTLSSNRNNVDSTDVIITYYESGKIRELNIFSELKDGPNQTLLFDSTGFLDRIKYNITYVAETNDSTSEKYGNYVVNWNEINFNKDGSILIQDY